MADVSMCKGGDCPAKRQCYRFMATRSLYQSWIVPMKHEGVCVDFISHRGGRYPIPSPPVPTPEVDLLDTSKPLGTRLTQAEFEEIKLKVRNRHFAATWSKKGSDI